MEKTSGKETEYLKKTSEQESTLHIENVWARNGVPGENI
jgi:hypothetical protein